MALFGRSRRAAKDDGLAALSRARAVLEGELGLRSAGRAAVCFKAKQGEFVRIENELFELLDAAGRETGSRVTRREDEHGFEWIVAENRDLDSLVEAVRLVGSQLESRGVGSRLLAAIFRFDGGAHPVHLIYGYDRGAWWPFVPTGHERERDNERELELKSALERELPFERDLSRWFALFDAPV